MSSAIANSEAGSESDQDEDPPKPDNDRSRLEGPESQVDPKNSQSDASSDDAADEMVEHPQSIGRYGIVRQLGRGGFGFVYLADDPELHRRVAIKVPRWDRPLTANAVERFLKEGKLLAQIEHPSIVSVHDLGITPDEGIPYVVMQYVEGRTLEKLLKSNSLPLDRMLRILMQIAVALREAHKETIVHRDFKPSNVIIDNRGRVHLVDFGMALHDDLTLNDFRHRSPVGTPQFMSPEQVRGENHRIDGRTDIWAFGVTTYLALASRPPFSGDNRKALMRAICFKNPRPLRQLNDLVSPELERVCLRCLSKLMDERYQSMADLIDELKAATLEGPGVPLDGDFDSQAFSSQWSGFSRSEAGSSNPNASGDWSRDSLRTSSDSMGTSGEALQFIPKGLRAFDENDSDFFVRLLPGPVDRLGIPESIRFWSGRLGSDQQVERIPVGVLYGPSGCGKSSFVRAGLIPRLTGEVTTVYVDCTSPNLSKLMIERLFRAIDEPMPEPDMDLSTCFRMLRQSWQESGRDKIVVVLDQFEQWLESCPDYAEDELTRALRQCDADALQCLILVRDDYWMSISSFMRCLEQRIEEGKNAMSLPLFDRRHARNVLRSYGRSVGTLPSAFSALNRSQKRFVREAVESISHNGSVLCVHLTILADMLADSEWGKQSFNKTFGSDSIGNVFLQRHLDDNIRVTKAGWLPICETIFAELLPPAGETSLKAHDRKKAEIKQASGNIDKSKFEDCLNFLCRELKLVTEVEPDNITAESGFRLTHDFFVIPIQLWLNRRRSSTMAGRTRARFDQLNHQYQLANSNRYLPNPIEYLMSLVFIRQDSLNMSAKKFRITAHRYYLTRSLGGVLLIAILALAGTAFWNARTANQAYTRLFDGDATEAMGVIEIMKQDPDRSAVWLESWAESEIPVRSARSNAALLQLNRGLPNSLLRVLNHVDQIQTAAEYELFRDSIECYQPAQLAQTHIEAMITGKSLAERVRLARLHLELDAEHGSQLSSLLENVTNPNARSMFTDCFEFLCGDLSEFCDWLESSPSADAIFGGVEALAFLPQHETDETIRQRVQKTLEILNHDAADPGEALMIQFCASRWNISVDSNVKHDLFDQHVLTEINGQPIHMIRVAAGSFVPAPVDESTDAEEPDAQEPAVEAINVPAFYVAPIETTVAMFKEFIDRKDVPEEMKAEYEEMRAAYKKLPWWNDAHHRNTAMRDLRNLNHIYEYLNWLSKEHNYMPAYRKETDANGEDKYLPVAASNGYRLPTVNETELISRGESEHTPWSWGDRTLVGKNAGRLERFAQRYQSNRFVSSSNDWFAVNSRAPNRLGIFEALGGVHELCHDRRVSDPPVVRRFGFASKINATNEVKIGEFFVIALKQFVPETLEFRIARTAD